MFIIVAGCGRLGANLATELSLEDHDVVIVDKAPDSFARLGRSFGGVTVSGTAIDENTLREAGIERADVFVAVTDSDAANVMAAQVAKRIFRVPKAIARITDPEREEAYQDFGITTICPTKMGVYGAKTAILADGYRRLLSLGDGLEVISLSSPREWQGRRVSSIGPELGLVIHAVNRAGRMTLATPDYVICAGDELVVTAHTEYLARLAAKAETRRS